MKQLILLISKIHNTYVTYIYENKYHAIVKTQRSDSKQIVIKNTIRLIMERSQY